MKKRLMVILGVLLMVMLAVSLTACIEKPEGATAPLGTPQPTPPVGEGVTTSSGLQYIEIEEGSGLQVDLGDRVTVHYRGTLEDGTEFDSSFNRGEPLPFTVGIGMMIPGFDEGGFFDEGGRQSPFHRPFGPGIRDSTSGDHPSRFHLDLRGGTRFGREAASAHCGS